MGEDKRRIFLIGSPALDKYINEPFIEKKSYCKYLINNMAWAYSS